MKGAAAGMTIVMNTHTATAIVVIADMNTIMTMEIIAVADMTTGISIITTTRAVVGKSTTTNISMAKAAAADMNIITATTFRVTRRTVSAKSAIRMKNTATCAAKALKTAPAVCRTLTA